ncbi:MAG TPA: hypothetical protein VFG34_07660 [Sphingopyxis sp.]|nr:hypothetical protein [Sphingopyxis sp.]
MNRNLLAVLSVSALSLFLAGCAGSAIPRTGTPSGTKTPPTARVTPPPVVRPVQNNILIGNSAEALSRSIGRPRIDVTEGSGRKMQFLGANCVLDVYFYPPSAGTAPVATHVDARTPDGRDMDVNRCAESMRRR